MDSTSRKEQHESDRIETKGKQADQLKKKRRTTYGKRKDRITIDTSKSRSLDVIQLCIKELKLKEFPCGKKEGGKCDFYWLAGKYSDEYNFPGGKINRFPGLGNILDKVNLGRSLDRMKSLFPDEYTFHPRQWFLPHQYGEFNEYYQHINKTHKHKKRKPVFIVKPDQGAQGEGIFIIHEPREYVSFSNRCHVVQEYIATPYLIDGLKFDFRVYVVLTSLYPLELFIYKEGLARFCTVPYKTPTAKNLHESFMHLTNYSLNKRSGTYVHTESNDDGSKRTMSSVFKVLDMKGCNTENIWNDMKDLVIKTIMAVTGELKLEHRIEFAPQNNNPDYFQILGFDILLDEHCKPYLLEVNGSPSLSIDYENQISPGVVEYVPSPVDEDIKKGLICDTLLLLAPKNKIQSCHQTKVSSSKVGPDRNKHVETLNDSYSDRDISDGENEDEDQHKDESDKTCMCYNSLEKIYPTDSDDLYDDLRILENAAEIFINSLGVRMQRNLGSTGFRNFTRICKVIGMDPGFCNASLDILYVDLKKRWDHIISDTSSGLCLHGFVDALIYLAEKINPTMDKCCALSSFLEQCKSNMGEELAKRSSGKVETVGRTGDKSNKKAVET